MATPPDGYFGGFVDSYGNLNAYGQQLAAAGLIHRTGNGYAANDPNTPLPPEGQVPVPGQPPAPPPPPPPPNPALSTSPAPSPYSPSTISVGADGSILVWQEAYDAQTGKRSYTYTQYRGPNDPGFAASGGWVAVAVASGLPLPLVQQQYQQGIRQNNQQSNGVLRNKNPDGTYSVTMPDGTVASKTLQDLATIPGISAGDIAQADKDFSYSEMRAKEADWTASGVQLYNGGAGPGAQAATMQPGAAPTQPAPPQPAPPPSPYNPPPLAGGAPNPPPTRGGGTAPPPAPPPTGGGGLGGDTHGGGISGGGDYAATQDIPQAQGASVATSMLPMQRATGAGGDSSGATTGASSTGTGNYGNSNGSWQDYELGTRGLQDQYERGNYTYQMGTPTYGQDGETRQQFSQRVNDLQNQYNMSKATFDLSHQGQAQANEAQQQAAQANKNQQMGQGRTIYGGGLGSLGPMRIAGLS